MRFGLGIRFLYIERQNSLFLPDKRQNRPLTKMQGHIVTVFQSFGITFNSTYYERNNSFSYKT